LWLEHGIWVLTLALALEYLWGDPKSAWHPVATLGTFARQMEQLTWKDSKTAGGLAWFLVVFGSLSIIITLWYHLAWGNPYLSILFQAALLWFSMGWKSLMEHARQVVSAPNIEEARQQVGQIVGRQTTHMNDQDIKRATLESLAENTSDAVIAPLFWFALLGVWGAWAYRIINTLDAMWGYRNKHYLRFGWFAAKADDAANFIPARMTALLILLQRPRLLNKLPSIYVQARQHQSPNAGFPETALAFMLGICLGGDVLRDTGVEHRARMGEHDTPLTSNHIQQGITICQRSIFIMLALLYAAAL